MHVRSARRTSLRAFSAAVLVGLLSLTLVFTQAPPAAAYSGVPTPVQVPVGVLGAGEAVAAFGAAAGGALAVAGAGFAAFFGTTALLNATFGPKGDDRSEITPSSNGYYFTGCTAGPCPSDPPDLRYNGNFALRNDNFPGTENGALYTFIQRHQNDTTGAVGITYTDTTDVYYYGGCGCTRYYRGVGVAAPPGTHVLSWELWKGSDVDHLTAKVWQWRYDPPTTSWQVNVKTTCRTATGVETVVTSNSVTVNPTANGALNLTGANCSAVVPGSHNEKLTVTGGRAGESVDLLTVPAWSADARTAYPNCTSNTGATGCQLLPTVNGVNCFAQTVECGGWATKTGRACTWGTYTVPDAWCTAAYSDFLSQPSTVPTDTTGPTSPVPTTVAPGTTVNNPDGSTTTSQLQQTSTGQWRTVQTTTYPDGSTTTVTTPTDATGTPTGASTTVTTPGTRPTDETAGTEDGCTFGLKPWLWPYRALKCAFLPSSATATRLGTFSSNIQSRVPFVWFSEIGGYVGGVLGGTAGAGCLVYDAHMGTLGTFHILDSCNDAEPIVHAIKILRPLLVIAELVAFLGPLAWWAWRQYAPLSNG